MNTTDGLFLSTAESVSGNSTCLSRKVGAVLVNGNNIATGFNTTPKGTESCKKLGKCIRREHNALNYMSGKSLDICRAIHAEQSVIAQFASKGISTNGATIYVTALPCNICARLIIESGIKRVVYKDVYPCDSIEMFKNAGVEVIKPI